MAISMLFCYSLPIQSSRNNTNDNNNTGAALLIDRLGRRRLFLISNAGMFFSGYLVVTALVLRAESDMYQGFAVWTVFAALYTNLSYAWAGNGACLHVYYSPCYSNIIT